VKITREPYVRPANAAQTDAVRQLRTRRWLLMTAVLVWLAVIVLGSITLMRYSYSWRTFTDQEGRFSVDLPGTPSRTVQQLDGGTAGKAPLVAFSLKDPLLACSFFVTYEDIPDTVPIGDDPQVFMQKLANEAAKGLNGSDVYQSPITVGKYPGREVSMSLPSEGNTLMKMCFVLVNARLFTLTVAPFPKSNAEWNVKRFFNSFKLIEQ
jgi:hypothetical protein